MSGVNAVRSRFKTHGAFHITKTQSGGESLPVENRFCTTLPGSDKTSGGTLQPSGRPAAASITGGGCKAPSTGEITCPHYQCFANLLIILIIGIIAGIVVQSLCPDLAAPASSSHARRRNFGVVGIAGAFIGFHLGVFSAFCRPRDAVHHRYIAPCCVVARDAIAFSVPMSKVLYLLSVAFGDANRSHFAKMLVKRPRSQRPRAFATLIDTDDESRAFPTD